MTQKEIISAIAHFEIAMDMQKNVPGMEGFSPHFLNSFKPRERNLMKRYAARKAQAHADLAKLFEEKYGKE